MTKLQSLINLWFKFRTITSYTLCDMMFCSTVWLTHPWLLCHHLDVWHLYRLMSKYEKSTRNCSHGLPSLVNLCLILLQPITSYIMYILLPTATQATDWDKNILQLHHVWILLLWPFDLFATMATDCSYKYVTYIHYIPIYYGCVTFLFLHRLFTGSNII